jgi:hypothetical protein
MKHIKSSDYETGSDIWKYARLLEEKRGHNFEYWNTRHEAMIDNDWELHYFKNGEVFTYSESIAKEVLKEHRSNGQFARIVCGIEKTIQRRKSFSVIFKLKHNVPKTYEIRHCR